ncbi:unnamed protein product [Effrenium voratum]|uniref:Ubiquitin-like domain-containing protein n=1 Tax=Effrenium voratum TaxID=2562239 RepID=A0AA36J8J4_9DINO|nr:unnamed protein product [Effrenium voratum]CAJ1435432.1 unnamed protein product [Effrenium voratum]
MSAARKERQEQMVAVTLKLVGHDERSQLKVKMPKTIQMTKVKERVEMEFDVPAEEQIILFQGKYIAKRYMTQKENAFQPLNMPDLEEIVKESGEDGLQMTVVHKPFRLDNFMKKENVQEDDFDVKLRYSGASLLHRAVRRCEISVLQELLVKEEFTRTNARDRAGQTALHTACTAWQRESAEILLESENFQAVYKKDLEGRNALHYVACWGDKETARRLLAHPRFKRRHIEAEDFHGYTPLQLAEASVHKEVVEAIKEALSTKPEDDDELEPDEEPSRPNSPTATEMASLAGASETMVSEPDKAA